MLIDGKQGDWENGKYPKEMSFNCYRQPTLWDYIENDGCEPFKAV